MPLWLTVSTHKTENLVKNKVFGISLWTSESLGKVAQKYSYGADRTGRKGDRHEIILESKSPHISRGVDSSFQGIYLKYQIIEIQNT